MINKVFPNLIPTFNVALANAYEKHANKISYQLLNSLKSGYLDLSDCQISDKILQDILTLLSVLNITELNNGVSKVYFLILKYAFVIS